MDTASGAGVGYGILHSYTPAGASNIGIIGRRSNMLLSAKQTVEAASPGVKIHTFVADITDPSAIDQAFTSFQAVAGDINVCIHNAGYQPDIKTISDPSIEEWAHGIDVNVNGSFNVIRAFSGPRARRAPSFSTSPRGLSISRLC